MKYSAFLEKKEFSKAELIASAWGTLVEDAPPEGVPSLPAPPMLMFDRIVEVSHSGSQGRIVAEQDIDIGAGFSNAIFAMILCNLVAWAWMPFGSCLVFIPRFGGPRARAAAVSSPRLVMGHLRRLDEC